MRPAPATLVDSNILLDVITADPKWAEWSIGQLDSAQVRGALYINDVVFAELSVRFTSLESLEVALSTMRLFRRAIPDAALFLAAKVYLRYRQRGGLRTGVLPDFFIGAQAAIEGHSLLTRDPSPFRSYFPGIDLITP